MNWNDYEGRAIGEWSLDSFLGERDGKAFFASGQRLLQLVPRDADHADAALKSWNIARELSHQHLLRPYASGESVVGGVGVHYAVLDLPDDDLSELLSKRRPNRSEARGIVSGIESGLKYLHARGISHGALTPSNVFFLPGGVRLSVDTLRPVGDIEADLQQFGALRAQLGIGERPAISRKAIAAGAGIVLVLIAIFWLMSRATEPAPLAKVERPKATSAAPVIPKKTPLGPPINQAPERIASRPAYSGNSWGVVAATYKDYGIADKYASILRKRLPKMQVHVSPPPGQGKLYLVVLGSGLTREQADDLRSRAVPMGAPRDCYVTKLDEP